MWSDRGEWAGAGVSLHIRFPSRKSIITVAWLASSGRLLARRQDGARIVSVFESFQREKREKRKRERREGGRRSAEAQQNCDVKLSLSISMFMSMQHAHSCSCFLLFAVHPTPKAETAKRCRNVILHRSLPSPK